MEYAITKENTFWEINKKKDKKAVPHISLRKGVPSDLFKVWVKIDIEQKLSRKAIISQLEIERLFYKYALAWKNETGDVFYNRR